MHGSGKQAEPNGQRYPRQWTALAVVVRAAEFLSAGIWIYVLHQPSGVNPVKLQWWAGSTAAAMSDIRRHSAMFRTALDWDLRALIPGYLIGLLLACGLGGRVFWASRFPAWARRGVVAAVAAGARNMARDQRPLRPLGKGVTGTAVLATPQAP